MTLETQLLLWLNPYQCAAFTNDHSEMYYPLHFQTLLLPAMDGFPRGGTYKDCGRASRRYGKSKFSLGKLLHRSGVLEACRLRLGSKIS